MILKILKLLFIISGGILLINALIFTRSIFNNIGVILLFLFSISLILFGIYLHKIPIWLKAVYPACVGVLTVFLAFLYIYGAVSTATYKEDALIVLGAGLKGDKPSQALKFRLNCAVEYHKKNPNALIVVSGGQGRGESITEAEAMKRYLIKHGVNEDIIIKEELSTSTEENFLFSYAVLKERLGQDFTCAFTTNGFHVYRSKCYAEKTGIKNINSIGASTPLPAVMTSGIREVLAVLKLWVFDMLL